MLSDVTATVLITMVYVLRKKRLRGIENNVPQLKRVGFRTIETGTKKRNSPADLYILKKVRKYSGKGQSRNLFLPALPV